MLACNFRLTLKFWRTVCLQHVIRLQVRSLPVQAAVEQQAPPTRLGPSRPSFELLISILTRYSFFLKWRISTAVFLHLHSNSTWLSSILACGFLLQGAIQTKFDPIAVRGEP